MLVRSVASLHGGLQYNILLAVWGIGSPFELGEAGDPVYVYRKPEAVDPRCPAENLRFFCVCV